MNHVATPIQSKPKGFGTKVVEYLKQMGKYKFIYLLMLPGVLLLSLIKIYPMIHSILMPFYDRYVLNGIWPKTWSGLDNFVQLFRNGDFHSVLINTIVLKLAVVLLSGAISLFLSLALYQIKRNKIRNSLISLFLLPYFIPSIVCAYIVFLIFPWWAGSYNGDISFLNLYSSSAFKFIYTIFESIKVCGIPVLLALAAIMARQGQISQLSSTAEVSSSGFMKNVFIPALKAIAIFMLLELSFLLSTNFEFSLGLFNSGFPHEFGTIDTFAFQHGFSYYDTSPFYLPFIGFYGAGTPQTDIVSAIWFLKFIVHLLLFSGSYFIIKKYLLAGLFEGKSLEPAIPEKSRPLKVLLNLFTTCYSLIILLILCVIFLLPFILEPVWKMGTSIFFYFAGIKYGYSFILFPLISMLTALGSGIIALTLSYPLLSKGFPGRRLLKIILIFALCGGTGATIYFTGGAYEFLYLRNIGNVAGILPYITCGLINIFLVFILYSFFNARFGDLREKSIYEGKNDRYLFFKIFIPKTWKLLLGILAFQFAGIWNSYLAGLIHIQNYKYNTPMLFLFGLVPFESPLREMAFSPSDPWVMKFAVLLTLPPIIVFLLCRRFLFSELGLGIDRRSKNG